MRELYHGVLQVGVGLHHWSRGNHHGAGSLLEAGITRLAPFAPACQRVDVASLISDARRARDLLIELGPERMREIDPRTLVRVRLL